MNLLRAFAIVLLASGVSGCQGFDFADKNKFQCNGTIDENGKCSSDCAEGYVLGTDGVCCLPDCEDKQCGDDGCGGTCGDCEPCAYCEKGSCLSRCEADQICTGEGCCGPVCTGKCGGVDGCGGECPDECKEPLTCGGGGVEFECGCMTNCAGKCGGPDACGGTCPNKCVVPDTCGGGGQSNICGCAPKCAGKCSASDGCGGVCPDNCEAPAVCGGGGVANVCSVRRSCKEYLATDPNAKSGEYVIDPDGPSGPLGEIDVYCDLSSRNGGWTLIAQGGRAMCGTMDVKTNMSSDDSCGYLPLHVVKALAAISSDVKLDVNESNMVFGRWTSTSASTNSKAVEALLTANGTWHNGAKWDNWDWTWSCAPPANGWPNMFQACGNGGGVHWVLPCGNTTCMHDKVYNVGTLGQRSATWVR